MTSTGGSIGGLADWVSGLLDGNPDLALEPDSIREWLGSTRDRIGALAEHRAKLVRIAIQAGSFVQLGQFSFSDGIRAKIVDRIGTGGDHGAATPGSLVLAIDNAIEELTNLHEALRRALEAHLGADYEAERIINALNSEAGE